MPETPKAARTLLATAALGALVATGIGIPLVAGAPPADAEPVTGAASVSASADAFTDSGAARRTSGGASTLSAGTTSRTTRRAFLKFAVPALPSGATLTSATLTVQLDRSPAGTLRVHTTGNGWTEAGLNAANAPAVGGVVASGTTSGRVASFDVTGAVRPGATVSYAVTSPSAMSSFASSERPGAAPALALAWSLPAPTTTTTTPPTTTPEPTTTTTTTPPPTTPPPTVPPVATDGTRIGMSAPRDQWDTRLRETGPVASRRLFGDLAGASSLIALARSEVAAGRLPIMSFKLPRDDWAGGAAGTYDAQLRDVAAELGALRGRVFVTIHHEPTGDGEPAAYAAMQRHVLPILGAPANVDAGVIVNGFWWSARAAGYTDAEIAQWLPADVLELAEVVAADTYQGGTTASPGEDAGVKIRRMSQWATRVGVERLGIGEYNGLDAASLTAAGDAILADPRFVFAAVFNSSENNREGVDWLLVGDRLAAFRATLDRASAGS